VESSGEVNTYKKQIKFQIINYKWFDYKKKQYYVFYTWIRITMLQ
jgi:hypothetical protein